MIATEFGEAEAIAMLADGARATLKPVEPTKLPAEHLPPVPARVQLAAKQQLSRSQTPRADVSMSHPLFVANRAAMLDTLPEPEPHVQLPISHRTLTSPRSLTADAPVDLESRLRAVLGPRTKRIMGELLDAGAESTRQGRFDRIVTQFNRMNVA